MLRNRLPVATAAASLAIAVAFHATRPTEPAPPSEDQAGALSLDARLSHRVVNEDRSDIWAQIDINAMELSTPTARPPMDLVLIIDRSGSMDGPKMAAAKDAVRTLTALVGPDDRVALVSFSEMADVDTPLTPAGSFDELHASLDRMMAMGGTNIYAAHHQGVRALKEARPEATQVMLLISDGQPTVGETSRQSLARLAKDALQDRRIALTTIGVGDDFHEGLLGDMATSGGGKFYYAPTEEALAEKLRTEWAGLSTAVARGARVKLRPKNGVKIRQIHGFSTEWDNDDAYIHLDSIFSGARRRIMVELDVPRSQANLETMLDVELAYDDLTQNGELRSAARKLRSKVVHRPLVPSDINVDVLARARLVQSAQVIASADEFWANRNRDGAERLLRRQQQKNKDFLIKWGRAKDVETAQQRLMDASRDMHEVIQEKRQIRIRKKRKRDTIEIIAGD